jgi:hypothetical protein
VHGATPSVENSAKFVQSGGSTVVEHSSHHPKVNGLKPAGDERERVTDLTLLQSLYSSIYSFLSAKLKLLTFK